MGEGWSWMHLPLAPTVSSAGVQAERTAPYLSCPWVGLGFPGGHRAGFSGPDGHLDDDLGRGRCPSDSWSSLGVSPLENRSFGNCEIWKNFPRPRLFGAEKEVLVGPVFLDFYFGRN